MLAGRRAAAGRRAGGGRRRRGALGRLQVVLLDVPLLDVSSSGIRERAAHVTRSAISCRTGWSSTSWRPGSTGDRHRPGRRRRAHRGRLSPRRRTTRTGWRPRPSSSRERFGAPPGRRVAGLLHDYCRESATTRSLAAAARYGIPVGPVERGGPGRSCTALWRPRSCRRGLDPRVTTAIRLHTVGDAGMTVLEKCLYLADFLRAGSRLPGPRRGAGAGGDVPGRRRGRGRASQPARHHRPRARGGPRRARVVQRDSCRALRDTAATGCAVAAAPRSSGLRPGSSTCWRPPSRSPPFWAPGT